MKATLINLTLLAACLLNGCASSQALLPGDTPTKVREKFGPPIEVRPSAQGGEDWTYQSIRYHTLSRDTYRENLSMPNGPSWAPNADRDANLSAGTRTGIQTESYREVSNVTVHFSKEGLVIPPTPQGYILNTLSTYRPKSGYMTTRD